MDASLFLTEIDIHHSNPLVGKFLRSYIIKHYLFFDKLIVGDSQFNNNPFFRNLLWDKESDVQELDCTQDLWKIVEQGFLVPATRTEYNSLADLRNEHESRQIEHLPSKEYVEFIDDKVKDQEIKYEINDVATAFRERVLEALDSDTNVGRGKISKRTSLHVKDYVLRQNPLLFDSFRKWMKEEISSQRLTKRDFNFVDKLTAGAYRHNVAIALNKNLDIPLLESRDIYPTTITFGKPSNTQKKSNVYAELKPTFILFPNILCHCPIEALIDIKQNCKYHKKVVKTLQKFRIGKEINFDTFVDDLENYLAETELRYNFFIEKKKKNVIFDEIIKTEINKYYKAMLQKPKSVPRAFIKGTFDIGLSILSFIPFLGIATNSVGLINAAYGTVNNIRDSLNSTGLHGYICGRSDSLDKIYEVVK